MNVGRFRIRGRMWTVSLVPHVDDIGPGKAEPDEPTCGECRYDTREILLRSGQHEDDLIDTAIHEWDHAEHPTAPHATTWRRAEQLAAILKAIGVHIDCGPCGHCGRHR